MNRLDALYDRKYQNEVWRPHISHPDALSTTRFDDASRLLRGESGRVLDVGCGAGQYLISLADRFDALEGIDLSPVRIQLATSALQQRYPEHSGRIQFQVASLDERLPYEDGAFDVVIASAVIEHVVNLFHATDEIARVTRTGGCVVITVPNVCYLKHPLGMLFGRLPLTGTPTRDMAYWREHGWDGEHLHYFSKRALTELLQQAGFTPEAWTGDGRLAKLRRWHTNLVGNLTVRARKR